MGCLNDHEEFDYWFGNIHFSGPCNRKCYFCIGQHMMALDPLNNLKTWPLKSLEEFGERCQAHGVEWVYLTGSNTDPTLYAHANALVDWLIEEGFKVGLRTNGVRVPEWVARMEQVSVSVTTFDPLLYRLTMGCGKPPDLSKLTAISDVWANVVLTPETVHTGDVIRTLATLREAGIQKANLREPYGQPHVGDPLKDWCRSTGELYGNPKYDFHGVEVVYWDVHTTGVKSVNLYASGRISEDYSVTKGHAEDGYVLDQSHFPHGRQRAQWR